MNKVLEERFVELEKKNFCTPKQTASTDESFATIVKGENKMIEDLASTRFTRKTCHGIRS